MSHALYFWYFALWRPHPKLMYQNWFYRSTYTDTESRQKYIDGKRGGKQGHIYSHDTAMLKRVETKQCTLSIRHHYEAVPKIHIDASIWILASICDCGSNQIEYITKF